MQAALTSLILPVAELGGRVNWVYHPRSGSDFPYCVLRVISWGQGYTSCGAQNYADTRVQADIWGVTYEQATGAAAAVRALLSGYQGVAGGVRFQGIFLDRYNDSADENTGEETRLYRASMDFNLHWSQEI